MTNMRNPAHASRLVDYDGWPLGNMTPSDIDAVIEFKNECWIFIDYKYGDIIVGQYNDIILNSHIDAISVIVDSGDETIRANVRGVADA